MICNDTPNYGPFLYSIYYVKKILIEFFIYLFVERLFYQNVLKKNRRFFKSHYIEAVFHWLFALLLFELAYILGLVEICNMDNSLCGNDVSLECFVALANASNLG